MKRMKAKYKYKTLTDKKGNVWRVRCHIEHFKDVDTGQLIPIERQIPIKKNGERVYWIPSTSTKRNK